MNADSASGSFSADDRALARQRRPLREFDLNIENGVLRQLLISLK